MVPIPLQRRRERLAAEEALERGARVAARGRQWNTAGQQRHQAEVRRVTVGDEVREALTLPRQSVEPGREVVDSGKEPALARGQGLDDEEHDVPSSVRAGFGFDRWPMGAGAGKERLRVAARNGLRQVGRDDVGVDPAVEPVWLVGSAANTVSARPIAGSTSPADRRAVSGAPPRRGGHEDRDEDQKAAPIARAEMETMEPTLERCEGGSARRQVRAGTEGRRPTGGVPECSRAVRGPRPGPRPGSGRPDAPLVRPSATTATVRRRNRGRPAGARPPPAARPPGAPPATLPRGTPEGRSRLAPPARHGGRPAMDSPR